MAQLKVPYVGLEEVTDKPWAVGKALAAVLPQRQRV
jgi:hypothetical protein